jgi:mannosyltransferase OCH1-like enzyme
MVSLKQRVLPRVNVLASRLVDYPFKTLQNQVAVNPRLQKIPNSVTQTWEENAFGRRHFASINRFRSLNLDLNFWLFDAAARNEYMRKNWSDHPIQEIYEQAIFGPLKADIFRYCIIFERGGYYFDISKGLNSSIISLHSPEASGLISFEGNENTDGFSPARAHGVLRPEKLVIQWAFGFTPKHDALAILISDIVGNFPAYSDGIFAVPKDAILEFSGPKAMTRALHKYFIRVPDNSIAQLDLDFAGHGIYSLRGSGARHHRFPSYASIRDSKLFS